MSAPLAIAVLARDVERLKLALRLAIGKLRDYQKVEHDLGPLIDTCDAALDPEGVNQTRLPFVSPSPSTPAPR